MKPTTNEEPDNCAIRPEPVLPPLTPDPLPDLIKPVETRYKGHRFRSRLEARWAVFFDEMNVEWLYESEGFMVGDRPYLPDFWLPEWRCWVEVKGVLDQPTLDLLLAAADGNTGLPADPTGRRWTRSDEPGRLLLLGDVPDVGGSAWLHTRFDFREGVVARSSVAFIELSVIEGPSQSTAGVMLIGEPLRRDHELWPTNPVSRGLLHGRRDRRLRSDAGIRDAYAAARAARFEHGEYGAPKRLSSGPLFEAPEVVPEMVSPTSDGPLLLDPLPPPQPRRAAAKSRAVRSGPEAVKKQWPKVVQQVQRRDERLGKALAQATVVSVNRRTVLLAFKDAEDCTEVSDMIQTVKDVAKLVFGVGPWAFLCKAVHVPVPLAPEPPK